MKVRSVAIVAAFALLSGCKAPVHSGPLDNGSNDFSEMRPRPEVRQDQNERRRSDGDEQAYDRDHEGSRGRRSRRGHASNQSTPGDFDFYLLNLSWSPEFCATHPQSPECGSHLGFIVHGLWPQNNDGTYPEHCGDAPGPANPDAYRDIMPVASLVEHEWETHGTCSGQSPDAYFGMARKAFHEVTVPLELSRLNGETMLPPADILGAFAKANPAFPSGSIALSCGNNRLTAVEVCLSKELQPIPCESIRSCRAQQVKITSPSGR